MKIIFLDIDGVLNSQTTKDRILGYIGLDDSKILLLKEIIEATGAKIVLSSSWRLLDNTYKALKKRLKPFDIEIMDKTPRDSKWGYRGSEIEQWFKDWQSKEASEEIESFIILDDDNDLKPYGARHIQTSWKTGMSEKNAQKAIKMLGEECKPWFSEEDIDDKEKENYHSEHRQI